MDACPHFVHFVAVALLHQGTGTRQSSTQPLPPPIVQDEPIKSFPPLPLRHPNNPMDSDYQFRSFADEGDPIIRDPSASNFDIIYRACRDSNKHMFVLEDPYGYEYVFDRSLQESQGNIGSVWRYDSKLDCPVRITDIASISRTKTSGIEQEERTIVLTTGLGEVTWTSEVHLKILPTERFKQLRSELCRMPHQNNGSAIVTEFIIYRFALVTLPRLGEVMSRDHRTVTLKVRVERTRLGRGCKRVSGSAFIVNDARSIEHPFAQITWIDTECITQKVEDLSYW